MRIGNFHDYHEFIINFEQTELCCRKKHDIKCVLLNRLLFAYLNTNFYCRHFNFGHDEKLSKT